MRKLVDGKFAGKRKKTEEKMMEKNYKNLQYSIKSLLFYKGLGSCAGIIISCFNMGGSIDNKIEEKCNCLPKA